MRRHRRQWALLTSWSLVPSNATVVLLPTSESAGSEFESPALLVGTGTPMAPVAAALPVAALAMSTLTTTPPPLPSAIARRWPQAPEPALCTGNPTRISCANTIALLSSTLLISDSHVTPCAANSSFVLVSYSPSLLVTNSLKHATCDTRSHTTPNHATTCDTITHTHTTSHTTGTIRDASTSNLTDTCTTLHDTDDSALHFIPGLLTRQPPIPYLWRQCTGHQESEHELSRDEDPVSLSFPPNGRHTNTHFAEHLPVLSKPGSHKTPARFASTTRAFELLDLVTQPLQFVRLDVLPELSNVRRSPGSVEAATNESARNTLHWSTEVHEDFPHC